MYLSRCILCRMVLYLSACLNEGRDFFSRTFYMMFRWKASSREGRRGLLLLNGRFRPTFPRKLVPFAYSNDHPNYLSQHTSIPFPNPLNRSTWLTDSNASQTVLHKRRCCLHIVCHLCRRGIPPSSCAPRKCLRSWSGQDFANGYWYADFGHRGRPQ